MFYSVLILLILLIHSIPPLILVLHPGRRQRRQHRPTVTTLAGAVGDVNGHWLLAMI